MPHASLRSRLSLSFLALAVAVLAGCDGDSTLSRGVPQGRYDLAQVGGAALPVVIWVQGPQSVALVSERLTFARGGQVTRYTVLRRVTTAGDTLHDEFEHEMEYRRNADGTVVLGARQEQPCLDLCIPNDAGRLADDGWTLELESWRFVAGNQPSQLRYLLDGED